MYLSAERLALANQAVLETFEQCSIAWQAIPQWDTGDPGQIRVADGKFAPPGFILMASQEEMFDVSLAQANGPTPDALLTEVMAIARKLAKKVDDDILPDLYTGAATSLATDDTLQNLQDQLVLARATVEDAGYRAPSCLITNTVGLTKLTQFSGTTPILKELLQAGNINALHRTSVLDPADADTRLVVIGRRRRIAQGAAPEASPGEEPVDVAVSLPPSLEIDGETAGGNIQFTARIRYALRVTDANGLVKINKP
ncbi:hypothetical protein [Mycolicibacterium gadium]|jgi:hypothetical protein|nr:hypothetical protein [Mycolicibacterium gadium]